MSKAFTAADFWPLRTKNLHWSDGKTPLTGLWQGHDPVLIWGRGHVCIFPKSATGPHWLPEWLVIYHPAINSWEEDEDHPRSPHPSTPIITTNAKTMSPNMGTTQEFGWRRRNTAPEPGTRPKRARESISGHASCGLGSSGISTWRDLLDFLSKSPCVTLSYLGWWISPGVCQWHPDPGRAVKTRWAILTTISTI